MQIKCGKRERSYIVTLGRKAQQQKKFPKEGKTSNIYYYENPKK